MPEKIVLEDGTEREIPTEEELKALNEKATQAQTELETMQQELGVQEGTSILDTIKELKESANPNWPAAREKMKKLQQMAKDKGINVDDNGNVIDSSLIKPDELDKKIKEQSVEISFNNKREEVLLKYKDEERKVIEHYLDKLMTGEEKSVSNLLKFVGEAERLAMPDNTSDPIKQAFNSSGRLPRFSSPGGQVSRGAVEMGSVFGNTEDSFKKAGDVSDIILNK